MFIIFRLILDRQIIFIIRSKHARGAIAGHFCVGFVGMVFHIVTNLQIGYEYTNFTEEICLCQWKQKILSLSQGFFAELIIQQLYLNFYLQIWR